MITFKFKTKIRQLPIVNLISMEKTREQFPILDKCIYVNTAAAGLLSTDLALWRQQHDQAYLIGGSTMKTKAMKTEIPEIRETVANFFRCKTDNVALVPNFSLGFNILLEGLKHNNKVLLLENDYPSVNWPFEYRGFEVFYAKVDEDLEDSILEQVKNNDISILALSLVQWVNGIRIDLDFLKSLKSEFPQLIIIADGTQFLGTTDFNFEDSAIDILGASSYKWLLGGYGNGLMLFKDAVKEKFSVKGMGFNSADTDASGKDTIRFAKHFEPGHLDTLNFGSLRFSLNYLNRLGKDAIELHLKKLSDKAKKEFTNLGLLEKSVVNRKAHSSVFNIKGDNELFTILTNNHVICSQRGGGIRLSFHFYNTENDIEEIVRILKTAI